MAKNSKNTPNQGNDDHFPINVIDFYISTHGWFAHEVGAYIRLRLHEWERGHLPEDPIRLARISGMEPEDFNKVWDSVLKDQFEKTESGYVNHPRHWRML
ncbi:MAG: DUF1376 domain-containing protein [Sedimenticola sp.]